MQLNLLYNIPFCYVGTNSTVSKLNWACSMHKHDRLIPRRRSWRWRQYTWCRDDSRAVT